MQIRDNVTRIREICSARNGERCKDCVYYGKKGNNWRNAHGRLKPCEYDPVKMAIIIKSLKPRKGDSNNPHFKE